MSKMNFKLIVSGKTFNFTDPSEWVHTFNDLYCVLIKTGEENEVQAFRDDEDFTEILANR